MSKKYDTVSDCSSAKNCGNVVDCSKDCRDEVPMDCTSAIDSSLEDCNGQCSCKNKKK